MTGMKWTLSLTAKLLLVAVLGMSGSVLTFADDDGHRAGKDKILYIWAERSGTQVRRIFWP